jgi:hypothetical protein
LFLICLDFFVSFFHFIFTTKTGAPRFGKNRSCFEAGIRASVTRVVVSQAHDTVLVTRQGHPSVRFQETRVSALKKPECPKTRERNQKACDAIHGISIFYYKMNKGITRGSFGGHPAPKKSKQIQNISNACQFLNVLGWRDS